jgi:hypothetical protein
MNWQNWDWQFSLIAIGFWIFVGIGIAGFLPKFTTWFHSFVVGVPAAANKAYNAAKWLESKFKK